MQANARLRYAHARKALLMSADEWTVLKFDWDYLQVLHQLECAGRAPLTWECPKRLRVLLSGRMNSASHGDHIRQWPVCKFFTNFMKRPNRSYRTYSYQTVWCFRASRELWVTAANGTFWWVTVYENLIWPFKPICWWLPGRRDTWIRHIRWALHRANCNVLKRTEMLDVSMNSDYKLQFPNSFSISSKSNGFSSQTLRHIKLLLLYSLNGLQDYTRRIGRYAFDMQLAVDHTSS